MRTKATGYRRRATRGPNGKVTLGPKYRPKTPRTKKDLTKFIKAVTLKEAEPKYVAETIISKVAHNGVISEAGGWYRCLPLLKQGDADSQDQSWIRRGKMVTPYGKLAVHWDIHLKSTLAYSRDIYVVLYVLQERARRQYPVADAGGQNPEHYAAYLDDGAGNNTNFAGDWASSHYPVEKDFFIPLHKKVWRLCKPSGQNTGISVVGVGSNTGQYSMSMPVAIHHSWHYTLPKVLRYDDGPADSGDVPTQLPTNTSPIWGVGYFYANGEAADVATQCIEVSCRAEMGFKDM